jgi:hypothetical protein
MNEDLSDSFLKQLKPAPLPLALRARLAHPPAPVVENIMSHSWRERLVSLLPIAAALAMGLLLHRHAGRAESQEAEPNVTVRHHEKILLQSKRLQIFEVDGGYWELLQQQWKEESTVANTHSPIFIRSSEIKHTLVCAPVTFD